MGFHADGECLRVLGDAIGPVPQGAVGPAREGSLTRVPILLAAAPALPYPQFRHLSG